jgi:soluble lytic murein transglycosylase-like protein
MAHAVSNRFASSTGRNLDTIVALGLAALAIAGVIAGRLVAPGPVPSVRDGAASRPPIATVQPKATEPNRGTAVNIERAEVLAVTETAAKKYRVARNVMRGFVDAAYLEARRNRIDPLLVVAVIAIESGFNPVAQSSVGATGLMQVVPAYHAEKFPAGNGDAALDPRINIRVGTRVLKEYVSRAGTETAGLQRYAGSASDPHRAYATKVLAERARLREAARQARARLGARLNAPA